MRAPSWVGVNVTAILQFFPTANELPQGFVLVPSAKSPLAAMLLMLSVAVPVLATVTVFVTPVTPTTTLPHASEVGGRVTTGLPPLWVTVRLNVVLCVKLPDTPVMVTVEVPTVAVALAVRVNVLVLVVGFVPNAAVTPLGKPEALRVTLALKPFCGTTVMVLVPLFPCATDTVVGLAVRLKSGPPVTVRLTVVVCFKLPDVPVMVTVEVPTAAVALAVRVS